MNPVPVMRKGVRILRPDEYKILVNNIPKREFKTLFQAMLFTGMRYIELKRFQKHPSWFDGEFINLPKTAVLKQERRQMERSVRLNPLGKMAVEHFIECKKLLPSYQSWSSNMGCWGYHAGFPKSEQLFKESNNGSKKMYYKCLGLGSKTARKTWESWLMFYYPQRRFEIALSQGHTTLTSLRHYVNMPFTERDRLDMKEFVEGW